MILSRIMRTYLLLFFEILIFRNSIQSGDGILLSMTQTPPDDILKGWYKLRMRVSGELKILLELCNLENHQKKAGLVCHRLKTMVKRSIGQNLRVKNFGARNGNYEINAVVNQGTKHTFGSFSELLHGRT